MKRLCFKFGPYDNWDDYEWRRIEKDPYFFETVSPGFEIRCDGATHLSLELELNIYIIRYAEG